MDEAEIKAYMNLWRESFMAQAMTRIRKGGTSALPPALWDEAEDSARRHQRADRLMDDFVESLDVDREYRTADLLALYENAVGPNNSARKTDLQNRQDGQGRIAAALTKAGWVCRQHRYRPPGERRSIRAWWWSNPAAVQPGDEL